MKSKFKTPVELKGEIRWLFNKNHEIIGFEQRTLMSKDLCLKLYGDMSSYKIAKTGNSFFAK